VTLPADASDPDDTRVLFRRIVGVVSDTQPAQSAGPLRPAMLRAQDGGRLGAAESITWTATSVLRGALVLQFTAPAAETSAIRHPHAVTSVGSRQARGHSHRFGLQEWSRNPGCPRIPLRSPLPSSPYREFESRTRQVMRQLATRWSRRQARAVLQEVARPAFGLRCASLPMAASRVLPTALLRGHSAALTEAERRYRSAAERTRFLRLPQRGQPPPRESHVGVSMRQGRPATPTRWRLCPSRVARPARASVD
jgi:hypothetical protein